MGWREGHVRCVAQLLLPRAVSNLVDNAVAHGSHVIVRLIRTPDTREIVVTDNGPGIPAGELDRVTEPYVRLDAARALESGGVGLGLAIARDTAAYHGGTLHLSNLAGGGLRAALR